VPKSKQGTTTSDFPALGGNDFKPQGKQPEKKEPEDPCYGKPKEFFIYTLNPHTKRCQCTVEQMEFVACNYFEHYSAPIDILMWLYDMAEYRDDLEEQKRIDDLLPPSVKPHKTDDGKKNKKTKNDDIDMEESTFGHTKQKKKPAPISKP